MAATIYIVLRSSGDGWKEDGPHQTCRSAAEAIRAAANLRAENELDAAGEYVAIPARSWNPTQVDAQTVTTLTLRDVA